MCSLLIVLLRVHRSSLAQIATSFCQVLLLHHSPRPCYFPLCHVLYYCTIMHRHSNPVIGHMLHIFSTTAVSGILSPVPDPNMIHCLHQQPLARTVRTPHLHKPVLPGSSLTPTFNLLARSYLSLRKPAVNPFLNTGQNYLYAYMICMCIYIYTYIIYANTETPTYESTRQSNPVACPKNVSK